MSKSMKPNSIKNLLRYHKHVYLKSNQFIIPFIVLIIFLYTSYSIIPVTVVSSFSITMVVAFYIMIWISYQYADSEDTVVSQIITLKLMDVSLYNWSRFIFLEIISIILSGICVVFPIILNILRGFHVYTRTLTFEDVSVAFLLHLLITFMGIVTGNLFHPRIVRNRKLAVIGTFFLGVMAYVSGPLGEDLPSSRLITWVFPPLYKVLQYFSPIDYYNITVIAKTFLYWGTYGLILLIIEYVCLKKNRFM